MASVHPPVDAIHMEAVPAVAQLPHFLRRLHLPQADRAGVAAAASAASTPPLRPQRVLHHPQLSLDDGRAVDFASRAVAVVVTVVPFGDRHVRCWRRVDAEAAEEEPDGEVDVVEQVNEEEEGLGNENKVQSPPDQVHGRSIEEQETNWELLYYSPCYLIVALNKYRHVACEFIFVIFDLVY